MDHSGNLAISPLEALLIAALELLFEVLIRRTDSTLPVPFLLRFLLMPLVVD